MTWRNKQGELAQLVERCDRTAEVRGSNPLFSICVVASRSPVPLYAGEDTTKPYSWAEKV